MSTDQYTVTDPTKMYADIETKKQTQPSPGLDAKLKDRADLGEEHLPRHRAAEGAQGADHRRRLGHRRGDGHRVRPGGGRRGDLLSRGGGDRRAPDHRADQRRRPQGPAAARRPDRPDVLPQPGRPGRRGARRAGHPGQQRGGADPCRGPGRPHRRAVRPDVEDQRVRHVLDHQGRPAAPEAGRDDHQHLLRSRPTTRRPAWSTTPPPRPRSTPSPRRWPSSWLRRASGSTSWRRGRSGPRCRPRAASRRRSCPSSDRTPRSAGRLSRPSWPRRTCSWPPPESSYVVGETLNVNGGSPTP